MEEVAEELKSSGKILELSTQSFPTYLRLLLREEMEIQFLYCKSQQPVDLQSPQSNLSTVETSQLDLTGNPLEVDLTGLSTLNIVENFTVDISSWTVEENCQYPVSLQQARKCINGCLMKQESLSKPIYALCDGADKRHTVILGAQNVNSRLSRTIVYVLPCCYESGDKAEMHMKKLKEEHIKRAKGSPIKECLLVQYFYLYGCNLRHCKSLDNFDQTGSIAIEICSDTMQEKSLKGGMDAKMTLQVIVGHPISMVHRFWKTLRQIRRYLELLDTAQPLSDSTVICETPEYNNIYSEILDVLGMNSRVFAKKVEADFELNFDNLRDEDIADKLWVLLSQSRTLSDLRDNFISLFELLTDCEKCVFIFENKQSKVTTIIRGLSQGKLAVFPLTLSHSLELLIELGLEKLKEDYFTIIGKFHGSSQQQLKDIDLQWRQLLPNPSGMCARKSKQFFNPNNEITELKNNHTKFGYLNRMHTIVEYMYLIKGYLHISDDDYDRFCEALYSRYFSSNLDKFNKQIDMSLSLEEITLDVQSSKFGVTSNSPVAWSLRMLSSTPSSEVTSIVHFSEFPIFPPPVFNQYDLQDTSADQNVFYVTRVERYVNKIN